MKVCVQHKSSMLLKAQGPLGQLSYVPLTGCTQPFTLLFGCCEEFDRLMLAYPNAGNTVLGNQVFLILILCYSGGCMTFSDRVPELVS